VPAIIAFICALVWTPAAHAARDGFFTLSTEPSFFTGRFGGAKPINVYEIPLTLRYHGQGWRVSLQIPAVGISGSGQVSGGAVIRSRQPRGFRAGLGDIWLGVDVRLIDMSGVRPRVIPYVRLKIPTASRAMGLGTGAPDEEVGSRFEWRAGRIFLPFIQAGYRFTGQAPRLRLQNAFIFEAGANLLLGRDRYASVIFEDRGALQRGLGPSETLTAVYGMQVSPSLGVQVFVVRGLTPDSPSFGCGLGATMRF
jgi:hypothetical protein